MASSPSSRARRWGPWLSAAALLAAGAAGFRALASLEQEPTREEQRLPRTVIRALKARRQPWEEWIEGYGRARPLRRARVAAEVGGRVVEVAEDLEAGSKVSEGRVLVRLDDREFQERVREAEAQAAAAEAAERRRQEEIRGLEARLASAKRERDAAARELAAIEKLVEEATVEARLRDEKTRLVASLDGVVADLVRRIEEARVQLEADRAELAGRRAALARARLDLERTAVKAPWAGVVVAREVSVGDWVSPGTELFELVDPYRVEVPVELPASRYGDVRPGAAVLLSPVGREDVVRSARVDRVAPLVAAESRTFEAYVVLDGPEEGPFVPPGTFLRCRVAGRTWDAVIPVPRIAFVGDALYVFDPEEGETDLGLARRVVPRVVRRLPDVALVGDGLVEGELVVLTNLEKIADGTRLRLGDTIRLGDVIENAPLVGESR